MQAVIQLLKIRQKNNKIKWQTTTNKANQRRAKTHSSEDDISKVLLLSNNTQKNAILIIFLHLVYDKDNKLKKS